MNLCHWWCYMSNLTEFNVTVTTVKLVVALRYYRRHTIDDVKIGTHSVSLPLIKIKVCFLRLVLC